MLSTLPISPNKTETKLQQKKQKLASVSLRCKSRRFKATNTKFYPQILSKEDSFYICEKPLTEINVIASFCALNLRISV